MMENLSRAEVDEIALELPYPPSLNAYYQPVGSRLIIKAVGKRYRERVRSCIRSCNRVSGWVRLEIQFYPPDNRKRDVDNLFKCFFDAIKNGLIDDDSEIKEINAKMLYPVPKQGLVFLRIRKIKQ